jgi:uncharacterized protein YkwD
MTHTTVRHATLCARFPGLLLLFLSFAWWSGLAAPTPVAAGSSFHVYLPIVANPGAPNSAATTLEQQVVDLTNQLRLQNGCAPLNISPELSTAARAHSQDMATHDYFDHTSLSGQEPEQRAEQAGYAGQAGWENIAAGQSTAAAVVATWYNETPPNDGHRRNILNCSLTEIGVGYAVNPDSTYGVYWTQDFGQR